MCRVILVEYKHCWQRAEWAYIQCILDLYLRICESRVRNIKQKRLNLQSHKTVQKYVGQDLYYRKIVQFRRLGKLAPLANYFSIKDVLLVLKAVLNPSTCIGMIPSSCLG